MRIFKARVATSRRMKLRVFVRSLGLSYSQLASDVTHNLRARRGRYIPRDQASVTFASAFLEETGPRLPVAVRGQDWLAALGYV